MTDHVSATDYATVDNDAKVSNTDQVRDQYKYAANTPIIRTKEDEAHRRVNWRNLRRRVDWRIMPISTCIYAFNFLDKVAFNYAAPMGMNADLGLQGNEFSNSATWFFVAYLIAQVPSGLILTKFSASKYLAINVILWGVATCCTAASTNYRTLLTCRVFIGIFEAPTLAALMLIVGRWYNESEQAYRHAFWYCGLGAGQIVGGLLSFGFQHVTNSTLPSWKMMFIALGAVTILLGLATFFLLPDSPDTASFLSDDDKARIQRHLSAEKGKSQQDLSDSEKERVREWLSAEDTKSLTKFDLEQVRATFTDPQTFLLCFLVILPSISSGVIMTYSATLIRNDGHSPKAAALLNIPSGVISLLSSLGCAYGVRRWSRHCLWYILSCLLGLTGAALMSFSSPTNETGRLLGIYLVSFVVATVMLTYDLATLNTIGCTKTKKTLTATLMSFSFGVGNIIGPQTFRAQDAPEYIPARIVVLATQSAAVLFATILIVYYLRQNRKRKEAMAKGETPRRIINCVW